MTLAVSYFAAKSPDSKFGFPVWTTALIVVLAVSSSNLTGLSAISTPILTASVIFFIAKERPATVLLILGATGLIHAGIGLVETLTHSSAIYTGWKDPAAADVGGVRRAASLVGDPNYLGLTLICCLPGVVKVVNNLQPPIKILIWISYAAALILTFSRGAFLGVAIVLCHFGMRRYSYLLKPSRVFGLASAVAACLFVLVGTPLGRTLIERFSGLDASTRSRSALQSATLELFQQNWLVGLGLGNLKEYLAPLAHSLVPLNATGFRAFLPQTDPLNTYLLVGAESGALGLVLVFSILFIAMRRAWNAPLLAATVLGLAATAATLDLVQSPIVWCIMVLACTRLGSFNSLSTEEPVSGGMPLLTVRPRLT
ncbi:hypothetical protein GU243_10970 [Pseudarthrobacter psychrotolerans]|uniref:O-antigen ligase-related domain-containing protein n=1 Tax=Pseudarthrobacter psychrotolerans TaxID=2697569 RepID=A0A6P1NLI2_9MICC|nr:hypothetical protein GU243_10970 [Pseudarthrobacter psychrotolerans]